MTASVSILADSIGPDSPRLLTVQAEYPRFIHPEVLRHRPMSHSVASSRAIPTRRLLRRVIDNPAEPMSWGRNQAGMQAGDELEGWRLAATRGAWHGAKLAALGFAWIAMKAGAHKQVVNRIIEPWTHTVEIVTATEEAWENFFRLRIHEAADPTIHDLAIRIRHEMNRSLPAILVPGDWHLPLVTKEERTNFPFEITRRISAARCARVSYLNHDKSKPMIATDLDLADRLMRDHHWSPFEHQATPDTAFTVPAPGGWKEPHLHGNLTGWVQFRKQLEASA